MRICLFFLQNGAKVSKNSHVDTMMSCVTLLKIKLRQLNFDEVTTIKTRHYTKKKLFQAGITGARRDPCDY